MSLWKYLTISLKHFQIIIMPCPSEYLFHNIVGREDWHNAVPELPDHLQTELARRVSRTVRMLSSRPGVAMEMVMDAYWHNMQLGTAFCYALFARREETGDYVLPCDPEIVRDYGEDVEVYLTPLEWGVRFVYIKDGQVIRECSMYVLGHHTCV